jgi:hypothetical protein
LFGAMAAARNALHLPPPTVTDGRLVAAGTERARQTAGAAATTALAEGQGMGSRPGPGRGVAARRPSARRRTHRNGNP